MGFVKVIAVAASCLLVLAGCAENGGSARRAAEPVAYLYNGPFLPGEVSTFQPFIGWGAIGMMDTWQASPIPDANAGAGKWERTKRMQYAAQTRFVMSGKAVAWRLYLYGPGLVEAHARPGTDGTITVDQKTVSQNDRAEQLRLGAVHFKQMAVVQTPLGPALDSGWIWSPDAYRQAVDRDEMLPERSKRSNEELWRLTRQAMPQDRPIYRPQRNFPFVTMWWNDSVGGGWLARQVTGEAALAAIREPEGTYVASAPELAARDEIVDWLKQNFDPVAPYSSLRRACGGIPLGWKEDSLLFGFRADDRGLAGSRDRARALDTYAACVERFKTTYDSGPYAALYPQVIEKMREWQTAGGALQTDKEVPIDAYIPNYPSPAPEDVENAFDVLIVKASNPKAQARTELAERERAEADRRYSEAIARQKASERERRRRAAMRQAYGSIATGAAGTGNSSGLTMTQSPAGSAPAASGSALRCRNHLCVEDHGPMPQPNPVGSGGSSGNATARQM